MSVSPASGVVCVLGALNAKVGALNARGALDARGGGAFNARGEGVTRELLPNVPTATKTTTHLVHFFAVVGNWF